MTPDVITNGVKKYKGKILGGGAVSVITVIVLFFWDLGISRGDLKQIPDTNKHAEQLWEERIKVAMQLEKNTKSLDSLIVVVGYTNMLLKELRDKK